MKKQYTYNAAKIWASIVVLLLGAVFILISLHAGGDGKTVLLSVGCSLLATGICTGFSAVFVERVPVDPLKPWGISRIYSTRAEMNADCDLVMDSAKDGVDVIAFGMRSYRSDKRPLTEALLQRGVSFRILTMYPDSDYIKQRDREEGHAVGDTEQSVRDLIRWADEINAVCKARDYPGRIEVKGYLCMTLDFYWRVDGTVFVGPYQYGKDSQQMISFRFDDQLGADEYRQYFETLWNAEGLTKKLTK